MQINIVVTNDWVVVVSVSEWYEDIFRNWSLWYSRLNLGMETIVIAEDDLTYEKFKNRSDFKTIQFDMDEIENNYGSNMNYRSLGFNKLTSRRPFYLSTLIK